MNLSLGFVLGSLLFLTPALVLIGAIRVYYPIHRTLSFLKQGFVLPAAALVISAAINGSLFLDYVSWSRTHLPELWEHVSSTTVELLAGTQQDQVHRPGLWILKHVLRIAPKSDYNVLALILDVHLRVFIASVALIAALRLVLWATQWIDTGWYLWKVRGDDASKFISERSDRAWYNPLRVVQYIRDAIYHPWALLTSYNPYREILMVDIMCKGDNLYSGMFTSWTPHGEEAAATVAIQYIVRYYADSEKSSGHMKKPLSSLSEDGDEQAELPGSPEATPKSKKNEGLRRKIRFVERNGEMLFPWSEVINIHFWELRRGTKTIVTVRRESDLELAKWWIAINEVNPKKIDKIVIDFQGDGSLFQPRLIDWIDQRKLLLRNVEQLDGGASTTGGAPADPSDPTVPAGWFITLRKKIGRAIAGNPSSG